MSIGPVDVRLKPRLSGGVADLLREAAACRGRSPEKLLEMLIVDHCLKHAVGLQHERPIIRHHNKR